MKITIGNLRKQIKEILKETIDLGNIAFGEKRKEGFPFEKDSPGESQMLHKILDYIIDNKRIPPKTANDIKDILASGKYEDIFQKPDVEEIYRGIYVTPDVASKMLNVPKETFKEIMGTLNGNFIVSSKKNLISSWSKFFDIAEDFSNGSTSASVFPEDKELIGLIFTADISANNNIMFDLTSIYEKIDDYYVEEASSEEEVLCFGPVKAHQVSWRVL